MSYHASVTNSNLRSILLSSQSGSTLSAFVTENVSTISAVMLRKRLKEIMRFIEKGNLMNLIPLLIVNKLTLRTKAPKSVPQAVHFVTASSGT